MPVTIGIDPHKSTHTAVAVDRDEHQIARLTLLADRHQTDRLLAWAEHSTPTACGRSSPLPGSSVCSLNSCSLPASTSSICLRR